MVRRVVATKALRASRQPLARIQLQKVKASPGNAVGPATPSETPSMLHGPTEQFAGQVDKWHLTATPEQNAEALASYKRLMEDETTLVVARQLEMMEMLIGFDQESKYAVYNQHHQHLGYLIVSTPCSLLMKERSTQFRE